MVTQLGVQQATYMLAVRKWDSRTYTREAVLGWRWARTTRGVDVVVDDVGVPGACGECCEGTSDGSGPLGPLHGSKVV